MGLAEGRDDELWLGRALLHDPATDQAESLPVVQHLAAPQLGWDEDPRFHEQQEREGSFVWRPAGRLQRLRLHSRAAGSGFQAVEEEWTLDGGQSARLCGVEVSPLPAGWNFYFICCGGALPTAAYMNSSKRKQQQEER